MCRAQVQATSRQACCLQKSQAKNAARSMASANCTPAALCTLCTTALCRRKAPAGMERGCNAARAHRQQLHLAELAQVAEQNRLVQLSRHAVAARRRPCQLVTKRGSPCQAPLLLLRLLQQCGWLLAASGACRCRGRLPCCRFIEGGSGGQRHGLRAALAFQRCACRACCARRARPSRSQHAPVGTLRSGHGRVLHCCCHGRMLRPRGLLRLLHLLRHVVRASSPAARLGLRSLVEEHVCRVGAVALLQVLCQAQPSGASQPQPFTWGHGGAGSPRGHSRRPAALLPAQQGPSCPPSQSASLPHGCRQRATAPE